MKAAVLAAYHAAADAGMVEAFVKMDYNSPTVLSVEALHRSDDFEEYILTKPDSRRRTA